MVTVGVEPHAFSVRRFKSRAPPPSLLPDSPFSSISAKLFPTAAIASDRRPVDAALHA